MHATCVTQSATGVLVRTSLNIKRHSVCRSFSFSSKKLVRRTAAEIWQDDVSGWPDLEIGHAVGNRRAKSAELRFAVGQLVSLDEQLVFLGVHR